MVSWTSVKTSSVQREFLAVLPLVDGALEDILPPGKLGSLSAFRVPGPDLPTTPLKFAPDATESPHSLSDAYTPFHSSSLRSIMFQPAQKFTDSEAAFQQLAKQVHEDAGMRYVPLENPGAKGLARPASSSSKISFKKRESSDLDAPDGDDPTWQPIDERQAHAGSLHSLSIHHPADQGCTKSGRKIGRPLAYSGDPDAPGLKEEERRRIRRRMANRESARRVRERRIELKHEMEAKMSRLVREHESMRQELMLAEKERMQLMQQLGHIQELWSQATVETSRLLSELSALCNSIRVNSILLPEADSTIKPQPTGMLATKPSEDSSALPGTPFFFDFPAPQNLPQQAAFKAAPQFTAREAAGHASMDEIVCTTAGLGTLSARWTGGNPLVPEEWDDYFDPLATGLLDTERVAALA